MITEPIPVTNHRNACIINCKYTDNRFLLLSFDHFNFKKIDENKSLKIMAQQTIFCNIATKTETLQHFITKYLGK